MFGNSNFPSINLNNQRHLNSEVYKFAMLSEYPITATCGIRGWIHSLQVVNSNMIVFVYGKEESGSPRVLVKLYKVELYLSHTF